MPIRHSPWHVGTTPQPLQETSLATEAIPEDLIVAVCAGGGAWHSNTLGPLKAGDRIRVRLDTVPLDKVIHDIGVFGNQNTACAPKTPRWRHTVDRLTQSFPHFDSAGSAN